MLGFHEFKSVFYQINPKEWTIGFQLFLTSQHPLHDEESNQVHITTHFGVKQLPVCVCIV